MSTPAGPYPCLTSPDVVCLYPLQRLAPSPLTHGPCNSWSPASPVGGALMKGGCVSHELQPGLTCGVGGRDWGGSERGESEMKDALKLCGEETGQCAAPLTPLGGHADPEEHM